MAQDICSIDGCNKPRRTRAWCAMHYDRWRHHGDTSYERPPLAPAAERFWANVQKLDTGCWEWTAGRSSRDYGVFWPEGKAGGQVGAHRFSWKLTYGPIPNSLCVLHRCDNPPCVRPNHLFLGTKGDNSADCTAKGRHANQGKTHCPRGHPYSGDNLYISPTTGGRMCRTCKKARSSAKRRQITLQEALDLLENSAA
jgi:HNH endonuclease